jgi:hypothetical protein
MHNATKLQARTSLSRRIAEALPIPAGNPFATASVSVFAPTPADDAAEGSYEYRVVGEGAAPDVDGDADAVEVKVFWGRNLLRVVSLDSGKTFSAGEDATADCFIPAAKLGQASALLFDKGEVRIPAGARASITIGDAEAELRVWTEGHAVAMANGMAVRIELGDMAVEMRGHKRARKVALTAGAIAGGSLLALLGSFAGHVGILAAVASMAPALGASSDDELNDDQRYMIQQYLDASAQRETEAPEEALTEQTSNGAPGGDESTAAKGDPGKMGSPTALPANKRFAIKGDAPRPVLSRAELVDEATTWGAIGILNSFEGSKDEPHAEWANVRSEGPDDVSADGNLWGKDIGDAFGMDGLGLNGPGIGGGGPGEGIGISDVRTDGRDFYGCKGCGGFDNGYVRRARKGTWQAPRQAQETKVSGRIPPEVIQRIIRQNAGRAQACYQTALRNNPSLQGQVSVSFMIGRDGTVSHATATGSLPDAGVKSCVAAGFSALTFPKPDGNVTVSYGYLFTPAN